ncbi:MAG: AAA family ATPase [Kiritimatiellae bacterium]|nr:AAA family ATPase [Kiritimatiellia bacterium]MBQ6329992.1 AAA family ATPase [Kiritimatiellia bacterium]
MKAVLINRAVPGSGKTTFAKNIFAAVSTAGLTVAVHSTDDYFMRGGRYVFDVSMLGEYHRRNLAAFKESLAKGIDLVVVDNTNLHPWETEPYTTAARAASYRIILMNFKPREFEKHMEAQKVTPEKPDAHQVPESSMREHIADFNNYNELLDKNAVPDPARHFNYRWDETLQDVVRVPTPVKPFDYDVLIQITPETYHELKEKIGMQILCLSNADRVSERT